MPAWRFSIHDIGKALRSVLFVATSVVILSDLIPVASAPLAVENPVEMRAVTLAPMGTSPHVELLKMAEHWQKASGGRVKMNVIASYRAGGEAAIVDKMRVGGIDAALMTVVGLSKIDLGVTAMATIPMVFQSLDEVDYIEERLGAEVASRFEQKGFVVLFWTDIGWIRHFSVQPLVHPVDLKRMKVFVWAGNPDQVEIMKNWGTNPVSLDPADIFPSLSTGMINLVSATPFSANAGQYAMVTKHMLEVNWAPLVGGAIVRKQAWDKVPPDCRNELLKVAARVGKTIKTLGRKESDEAVEAMKKKQGLNVYTPSREVNDEWRQVAKSVYPKIRGTMVPVDMFDKVESMLREYRAKHGARGS